MLQPASGLLHRLHLSPIEISSRAYKTNHAFLTALQEKQLPGQNQQNATSLRFNVTPKKIIELAN